MGRGSFRWVCPLHRINILFDGDVLAGSFDLGDSDALNLVRQVADIISIAVILVLKALDRLMISNSALRLRM